MTKKRTEQKPRDWYDEYDMQPVNCTDRERERKKERERAFCRCTMTRNGLSPVHLLAQYSFH